MESAAHSTTDILGEKFRNGLLPSYDFITDMVLRYLKRRHAGNLQINPATLKQIRVEEIVLSYNQKGHNYAYRLMH